MRSGLINSLLAKYLIIKLDRKTYFYKQNIEWDLQQEGDLLYNRLLYENRFEGLLRKDQAIRVLINREKIDNRYQQHITRLEQEIRKNQVALYESFYQDPITREGHKKKVTQNKKALKNMERVVRSLDHVTLEGWADNCRQEFLLAESLYRRRRGKFFKCKPSTDEINKIYYQVMRTFGEPREIAKSNEWRFIWASEKNRAFKYRPLTLTQLSVISFSKMYDNISSHPDKPSEEIIMDDDALDGWLYKQKLKDGDKTKVSGRSGAKQNQFVFVDSQSDADRVYMSNDIEARIVQEQRRKKGTFEYAKKR